jgi:MFS family permease
MGLQIIAVPWLAVDYLLLPPLSVAFVQSAVLIPNVILLVLGGISADRGSIRSKFLWLLSIYALSHVFLFVLLNQNQLSFLLLLIYALSLGSILAFIQPLKDYLLGSLDNDDLQATIAKNNLSQYAGQATGIIAASPLYIWNPELIPLLQILLLVIAVICFSWLYTNLDRTGNSADHSKTNERFSLALLLSGFKCCWESTILRSLIAIVAVNGFFHIGVFIVALPILAKQIYIEDVSFYSLLQCLFILGTVVTTAIVIIRGQLDAPGRRVIFSVLYAGLILWGLSAGPTQYGLMFLIFLWGVVVGVSANLGRAILQSQAVAEYRGRIISVYQLALFGFAPLGSLFAGYIIEVEGVLYLLKVSAIVSLVTFFAMFLTRSLWDIEADDTKAC